MKKIAVILAGCGVYDGAEIHEAVLSMLAIRKYGAQYQIFAPDIQQYHVVNHITGEEMPESRNVLIEAARIARGDVKPVTKYNAEDFDALLFPGGFGVAKNLSNYAFSGAAMHVIPEIEQIIKDTHVLGKPIGALCVSPVLIAKVLGNVEITLGVSPDDAKNVETMGATHKLTSHGEVVYDSSNNIVTSPCYMLDATIDQIAMGADKVVAQLIALS